MRLLLDLDTMVLTVQGGASATFRYNDYVYQEVIPMRDGEVVEIPSGSVMGIEVVDSADFSGLLASDTVMEMEGTGKTNKMVGLLDFSNAACDALFADDSTASANVKIEVYLSGADSSLVSSEPLAGKLHNSYTAP